MTYVLGVETNVLLQPNIKTHRRGIFQAKAIPSGNVHTLLIPIPGVKTDTYAIPRATAHPTCVALNLFSQYKFSHNASVSPRQWPKEIPIRVLFDIRRPNQIWFFNISAIVIQTIAHLPGKTLGKKKPAGIASGFETFQVDCFSPLGITRLLQQVAESCKAFASQ